MSAVQGRSPRRSVPSLRLLLALALAAAVGVLAWLAARAASSRGGAPRVLVVYAFSIMHEVMETALLPAFRQRWLDESGETVEFVTAFAGSGSITERIIARYPAEVAILSSEIEAIRLASNGRLRWASWKELPEQGIVNSTPFVILVREGNPHGIRDFEDLTREGLRVVHSEPATSGGANWAILAEYGSALRRTGDRAAAFQQLLGIWGNVVARYPNAREARVRFEQGVGDALITYEQDLLANPSRARAQGEIVYPRRTVLSEHVVIKLDKNIPPHQRRAVDAFLEFLWSREAQAIFVDYGFRSRDETLNRANPAFGEIEDLFTLASLGGPNQARRDVLESLWRERVLPGLMQ